VQFLNVELGIAAMCKCNCSCTKSTNYYNLESIATGCPLEILYKELTFISIYGRLHLLGKKMKVYI